MKWKNRTRQSTDELSRLNSMAPHDVLNIKSDSSLEEIKTAYRQKVRIYHPDKSGSFMSKHNEEVIKIIIKCYKQLIDKYMDKK